MDFRGVNTPVTRTQEAGWRRSTVILGRKPLAVGVELSERRRLVIASACLALSYISSFPPTRDPFDLGQSRRDTKGPLR